MILLNSVLVATDFSDASGAALVYGSNLARAFGANLHVLHVTEDTMATAAANFYPDTFGGLQRQVEESARHRLEAFVRNNDRAAPVVKTVIRVSASPADAIINHAKEMHIDLIVVGTHGRTGVSRAVMGSVAERVARTAPCPVLIVRSREHEFVVPEPVRGDRRI
jgi:universal stress protein A